MLVFQQKSLRKLYDRAIKKYWLLDKLDTIFVNFFCPIDEAILWYKHVLIREYATWPKTICYSQHTPFTVKMITATSNLQHI